MPHRLLAESSPTPLLPGTYATGNAFLPQDPTQRQEIKKGFEALAAKLQLAVLGWRSVPVSSTVLGPVARSQEPVIQQPIVVGSPVRHGMDSAFASADVLPMASFNERLFTLRKQSTHQLAGFYLCSLSTSVLIYKGQLLPGQVTLYFDDLRHGSYDASFVLVHSRFSTNTFPSWTRAQPMRFMAHNGTLNVHC
jgi:glutamate synthase (NADPH/NADH)